MAVVLKTHWFAALTHLVHSTVEHALQVMLVTGCHAWKLTLAMTTHAIQLLSALVHQRLWVVVLTDVNVRQEWLAMALVHMAVKPPTAHHVPMAHV